MAELEGACKLICNQIEIIYFYNFEKKKGILKFKISRKRIWNNYQIQSKHLKNYNYPM